MIKFTKSLLLMSLIVMSVFSQNKIKNTAAGSKKVIVAYVTSWTKVMPDPSYVTHINYAFGHVNNTFDGIRIDNENRLKSLTGLKKNAPQLKIMLSVGGWGSGRFSEMAATAENRKKFAEDCLRVVNEFKLDGIDIDWEYPTSNAAKISSSPDDTQNYTLLMQEIRNKISKSKLLTLASVADAKYIDFKAIEPAVDFVNIMTYDMGRPPYHHAGLYRSKYTSGISVDEAVTAHLNAGMPLGKLVLGIPFYGHGKDGIADFIDYREIVNLTRFKKQWDEEAKVPFLENDKGEFVCTYETPESIAIKCTYLLNRGMLGAMYWEYSGDTDDGILRKAVFSGVNK
ncbi:MAG TPA: glycoside hydrolase family 18 protein [Pedobacter sp.]|uniref:glycoside hydrolase family 18 protein n=1 Tax=Pedobacter sp. TaxID=1411316 RepID=UPI002D0C5B1E|nr:glycoside hydrolase family 18 protein [Pedobacter sp.]HMI01968.1 glycoside hydrolase family 18 protein [Pedobacter sp.]